jgi:tetratricopeptide (TPR) repeat protein
MSTALPRVIKTNRNYSRVVIGLAVVAACLAGVVGYLVFTQITQSGQPATMADRDLALLQARLAKTPKDPSILARLAELEYEKGRVADAMQHGALAVKYAGTTPEIRLQYAGLLLQQHQPAQAKQLAQAEVDLPSTASEADAYFIMAQAQRDLNDLSGALVSMTAGLKRNPYAADARVLYADMLLADKQKAEAISQYQAALLFLPDNQQAKAALIELGAPLRSLAATQAIAPQAKPTPRNAR